MDVKFGVSMADTSLKRSLTGWSVNQVIKWRDGEGEESSACAKVVKQIVVAPAFIALTIVGVIELLARTILAAIVKAVDLFVPRECCISEISKYLINSVAATAVTTFIAAFEIIGNWMPEDSEEACGKSISDSNFNQYRKFFWPLIDYKLCTSE